ncbi:hypothetical protein LOK49_LG06G02703 [Camellia lanceoleosa]|uniref:Uncharacterized protein n=1 Tax=Camellia lanceoleosa TaxID=1840588 RepID=A0ACC0HAZ3_9ERIC|nr:hypothetical protein LOK49_LG06G02703 [Camellia lanceoleosa]
MFSFCYLLFLLWVHNLDVFEYFSEFTLLGFIQRFQKHIFEQCFFAYTSTLGDLLSMLLVCNSST